jgi:riboflavin biosynthesis pyrimidine reductase
VVEGAASIPPPTISSPQDELFNDFLPSSVVDEGQHGFFTVVDSRGRVRWTYKEFPGEEWLGWRLLVLVAQATPPSYLTYLRAENIPYRLVGEERVYLRQALKRMGERPGVRTVVSTAGGRLNGALLREGLVDEVDVAFLPAIIGGRGTPALFDAPPLSADEQPVRLSPITVDLRPNGHPLSGTVSSGVVANEEWTGRQNGACHRGNLRDRQGDR